MRDSLPSTWVRNSTGQFCWPTLNLSAGLRVRLRALMRSWGPMGGRVLSLESASFWTRRSWRSARGPGWGGLTEAWSIWGGEEGQNSHCYCNFSLLY